MGLFSSKKPILLNKYFIIESKILDEKSYTENIKDTSKWTYKRKKLKRILYQKLIDSLEFEPQIGDTICGRHTFVQSEFGRVKERYLFSQPSQETDHPQKLFTYRENIVTIRHDFSLVIELEPFIEPIYFETIDETPTKEMFYVYEQSMYLQQMGFGLRTEEDRQFWNEWYTKFEKEGFI